MVDVDDFDGLSKFFEDNTAFEEYSDHLGRTVSSCDDLFSILEALESTAAPEISPLTVPLGLDHETASPPNMVEDDTKRLVTQNSVSFSTRKDAENQEFETNPATPTHSKKRKISTVINNSLEETAASDGQKQKTTVHVTVERNRRKQMNEHLSVLRSLMPSFYVKRVRSKHWMHKYKGDQASIIGGVVDYIKEMQQVLQSLEAKKQRKFYSEILSPRLVSSTTSPRPSPILSPRKPPLSPRILSLPTSPRTPNQTSPCKPRMHQAATIPHEFPSSSSSTSENAKELVANSKSSVADVEVKFSGPNVLLKTVSGRIPGQVTKMIAALEAFSLEILHLSINIIEATMINSFTIKIGIECQLSADELAQGIQQTFCC